MAGPVDAAAWDASGLPIPRRPAAATMSVTAVPDASAPLATAHSSVAWAGDLPALPAAAFDLLALVNQEDVDFDELCARLSVDIALTAKVLRLANSSFYGARGAVTTVDAAIGRVGLRMVKGIVTAAAVGNAVQPPNCPGFDFGAFWRHAVASATAAQMLAFSTGADSSTAFTGGLLYRIGQLVFAAQAPGPFALVLRHHAALGGDVIEIERRVFGLDHAVVGAQVAAHWRLPPVIVQALAQQDPPLAPGQAPTLGQVVAAADRMVDAVRTGADPALAGPGAAAPAWTAAGAPAGFWAPAAADSARQAEAICGALQG